MLTPTVVVTHQMFGPIDAGEESNLGQGQRDGQVYPYTGSLFSHVSAVKAQRLSDTNPKKMSGYNIGVNDVRVSKRVPRKRFRMKNWLALTPISFARGLTKCFPKWTSPSQRRWWSLELSRVDHQPTEELGELFSGADSVKSIWLELAHHLCISCEE